MGKKSEKKYISFVKNVLACLKRLKVKRFNSKFSKRTYSNWVLIVLLALRQRMDKSYREFCDILDVCTEILSLLGISKAPHFTTLQKAAKRFRVQFLERVMAGFVLLTMTVYVRLGIDSTGLQPTRASAHYVKVLKKNKKSRRKVKNHIKLTTLIDLDKQLQNKQLVSVYIHPRNVFSCKDLLVYFLKMIKEIDCKNKLFREIAKKEYAYKNYYYNEKEDLKNL